MNTYRITVTTTSELDHSTRVRQFDVDALRSNTAIVCVLDEFSNASFFERDLINISSELSASDIPPFDDDRRPGHASVRPV